MSAVGMSVLGKNFSPLRGRTTSLPLGLTAQQTASKNQEELTKDTVSKFHALRKAMNKYSLPSTTEIFSSADFDCAYFPIGVVIDHIAFAFFAVAFVDLAHDFFPAL